MEDKNSKVKRAADHHLIMEAIHGTCNTIDTESGEAEADEGNEAETKKESSQERAEARP